MAAKRVVNKSGKKRVPPGRKGTYVGFGKLKSQLKKSGASNPGALAGYIGRKKYGAKKMGKFSAAGRRK